MNKYRQAPVERAPEPEKPWQPSEKCRVQKGDMATCAYKPVLFSIPQPCEVLAVEANRGMVSGWAVLVEDKTGIGHWMDGGYFKKHNPA